MGICFSNIKMEKLGDLSMKLFMVLAYAAEQIQRLQERVQQVEKEKDSMQKLLVRIEFFYTFTHQQKLFKTDQIIEDFS